MTDVDDFIKAEPARDRYGRYLITPPGGGKAKAYTRATTIAETLDDRYNLELWKIRMAMKGMAADKGIYAQAASLPLPARRGDGNHERWEKLGNKAIDKAKEHDAAALGEALHRFTERINRGEDVKVPAPWDADVAAYQMAIESSQFGIIPTYLERIVVYHELGIAGTFDLVLARITAAATGCEKPHPDVAHYIADLKTGATLDFSWGAIAVQLAIYAHADTLYDPATETHEPMPVVDQDTAIVIHLPAGKATCTLYKVDIAAGWEAAQQALWVRGWRKRKDLAKPCTAATTTSSPLSESHPASTPPVTTESTTPSSPSSSTTSRKPTTRDTSTSSSPTESISAHLRANPLTPPSPTIDEGGVADSKAIAALQKRWEKLTTSKRIWVDDITFDARDAARSIALFNHPTQRRYLIGRALVRFAELGVDDVTFRDALEMAIGDIITDTHGATVGALTLDQADTLNSIAVAIKEGAHFVNGALVYAA